MKTLKNGNFYSGIIVIAIAIGAVNFKIDYTEKVSNFWYCIPVGCLIILALLWGTHEFAEDSVFENISDDFNRLMDKLRIMHPWYAAISVFVVLAVIASIIGLFMLLA